VENEKEKEEEVAGVFIEFLQGTFSVK